MSADARIFGALLVALVGALVATPAAIRVAERTSFFDHPVGYKAHFRPTPYLGGAAVFVGFLVAAVALGQGMSRLGPVLAGGAVLWAVGTADDRFGASAQIRVFAEAVAAAGLYAAGIGWNLGGGEALDLVVTIVWVVAVVNAFNLMDNMDGAATTVAALSSLGTAILALTLDDTSVAVLAIALCGACLGFLPYNLASPARIFLGDGGSMLIGFLVAASIMALPLDGAIGWHRLLVGVLLVGVPALDTSLVMVSRWRAGVAVARGGRDHITHRLRTRLPSARSVALVVGAAHAAAIAIAIAIARLGDGSTLVAWLLLVMGVAALIVVFETPVWAPARAGPHAHTRGSPGHPDPLERRTGLAPAPARHDPRAVGSLEVVLLIALVAGCGLSPWIYGFYDLSVWGPIELGLLAVVLGLVAARPVRVRPGAAIALASLVALWGWSLVSGGWAEATDRAVTDGSRWMLYAALFAIYVLLLRDDRLTKLLLGLIGGAILALGLYLLTAMLAGDGRHLFLGQRLNGPLGYVNGEAGYLFMGVWPLVAVAERARRIPVAGMAVAGATILLALVLMCESRAVVPALVVTSVVLLGAVPGRRRRAWILLLLVGAIVAISGPLTDVYTSSRGVHRPDVDTIRTAAVWTALASVAAGALWALALNVRRMLPARRSGQAPVAGPALSTAGLVLVVVIGAFAVFAAVPHPVHTISSQYRAFTALRPTATHGSRLFSGGGNRYDYWRIAWREFREHPLKGVGGGNYPADYYRARRTTEDITQPHSIELQSLAELGIVGGLALLGLITSVLAGFARRVRNSRGSSAEAGIAVAAGGVFLAWLVHTSVDWLHLIPGVTGIALAGAAALLAPALSPVRSGRGRGRALAVVACAALVAFGAVFTARITLAQHYTSQANAAAGRRPAHALSEVRRALRLQESSATRYVQAAAFARLDDYRDARAALLVVTRHEPHNFLPWALLGDLAVRRGDLAVAGRWYGRAHALNPRDAELTRLARDPRAGSGG